MTKLDSILKSRDITLPTKVCLVKAMVFLVIMYGCESWIIKKIWALKNLYFWTVMLEKTLESPLDCRRSNQSILKKISPEYSLEGLMLKLKLRYFGYLMWTDSLGKNPDIGKDWRQEEKGMTEDKMVGWHHQFNGHGFEWTPGVGDGQGTLGCCSSWGHKSQTWLCDWTELYS